MYASDLIRELPTKAEQRDPLRGERGLLRNPCFPRPGRPAQVTSDNPSSRKPNRCDACSLLSKQPVDQGHGQRDENEGSASA
jgi:hypothetical protein